MKQAQNIVKKQKTTCKHCGELCEETLINHNGMSFCCQGCKLVYEIIQENDLGEFYTINEKPGISKRSKETTLFEYLKDETFADSQLVFKNEEISKIRLYLPAIHCSACIWLLEKLYKLHDGIIESRVDFSQKTASITFNHHKVSLYDVAQLLNTLGYPPVFDTENKGTQKSPYRKIWMQIGVAGFVFGNSMLFSLPEYFGMDIFGTAGVQRLFPLLNALLAIPVLLFSARDYFVSAKTALQQKQINMDVPISIGIITLFLYSYYIIFFEHGLGYLDSLSGLIFFLLIGKYYQQKTFDHLRFDRDVKSFFPLAVTKIEEAKEKQVLLKQILPGDTLRIRNGEIIPADSLLLSDSASIDYSFITGESLPEVKNKEDLIYAGGRLKGASILVQVKKQASQSYLAQLWDDESLANGNKTEVQQIADTISKYFTMVVLFLATASFAFWMMNGQQDIAWRSFTSVLIIACPCALALATPVTLGQAMRLLAKVGYFTKNSLAVEKLAKVDTIVFDKTGTLTYPDKANVSFSGELPSHTVLAAVKTLLNQSKHPVSRIVYNWLPSYPELTISEFKEINGQGLTACVDGKYRIKLGKRSFVETNYSPTPFPTNEEKHTTVYLSVNNEVLGCFQIEHVFREGATEFMEQLAHSFDLHLLSGDNDAERSKLSTWIKPDNMQFKQLPGRKKAYIESLRTAHKKAMMVGDGLNDAGALKSSYVGTAITESSSQFSPASDAIMMGKDLNLLPQILRFAKSSYKVVIIGFIVSFIYNVLGLSIAVQGQLSPVFAAILMPISSVTVVLIATIASRINAQKIFKNSLNEHNL